MLRLFTFAFACVLVAGCVPLEPWRTELPPVDKPCTGADTDDAACRHSVRESTPLYDLHFVEFDDQGLQYPAENFCAPGAPLSTCIGKRADGLQYPAAAFQINNLITQLNQTLATRSGGLAVVMFIHGWKHNARFDDENLANFRKLLATAAAIEAQQQTGRRVAGIFVSWRGQGIDLDVVNNVTFWSRKTAAAHVAEGSSREMFARLRAFKCVQNAKGDAGQRNCNGPSTPDERVKIVLIGHSFGGLILYNAISGSLIESMTKAFDADPNEDGYWRFADLTVLLNPAFEATRYTPLHRIASTGGPYERYETPLLITVTSRADQATGIAFPLGRAVNTLFERHASDEEREANKKTVGHMQPYLTHDLVSAAPQDVPRECAGWKPGEDITLEDFKNNLVIEQEVRNRFYCEHGDWSGPRYKLKGYTAAEPLVRRFCGGAQLTQTAGDPNVPVWNVSTDASIIPNHGDIKEKVFVDFFRQIYLDTVIPPKESCGRATLR